MTSIAQLIMAAGQDNITFQSLDHSVTGYKLVRGSHQYTFQSGEGINQRSMPFKMETHKLGLIIWLDREAVKQAQAVKPVGTPEQTSALYVLHKALQDAKAVGAYTFLPDVSKLENDLQVRFE